MKNFTILISIITLSLTSFTAFSKEVTLQMLWQQALKSYPSIAEGEANTQAMEKNKQAISAADKPQVNLKSELSYAWMAKDFPRTANQLKASYPLYQPDITERIDQANSKVQQSQWALESKKQNLRWDIAKQFYGILKLGAQKTYFEKQYRDFKITLQQVQQRYQVGYQSLNDVAEIQARMDQNQANLLAVQEKQLQALAELNRYLKTPVTLQSLKPEALSIKPLGVFNFDNHPALKTLQFKQQAIAQQQAIIQHQDGIKIQAFGAYVYNNSQGHYYDDMQGLKGGVEIKVPLYLGGRTTARQAQSRAQSQVVLAQISQKNRQLQALFEQAKLGIKLGQSRLKSLQASLKSNKRALNATEQGLITGSRNILDLLNAQNRVYKAEESIPLVKLQIGLDLIKAKWATGQLNGQ